MTSHNNLGEVMTADDQTQQMVVFWLNNHDKLRLLTITKDGVNFYYLMGFTRRLREHSFAVGTSNSNKPSPTHPPPPPCPLKPI